MTTTARPAALLDEYARALDGFDDALARVPAEALDGPSACSEWTIRDVVGHVVWGQDLLAALAQGRPHHDRTGAPGAPAPGVLVAGDAVTGWRRARARADATLDEPTLGRVVTVPPFGEIPLAGFVTLLVTDLLAHSWDVAHGAGVGIQLDPTLLDGALGWSRGHIQRGPGAIGPEVPVPADADLQARFLGFLGRDAARPVR
ncbi:TIGR03086 family metal-binding protein [Pseudonocardia sp. D17]|jgi:uncharacterized protein (TIGR03086 family)|uniref:TIGR03086 family metal-binding protein n=1 Tax=Pseudonocardia sp. D17 TaxID=882661 RepID=UPI002B381EF9|nr:hypothetical protein PSD17_18680 [Pseudonocardia sp. D17]